MIKKNLDILAVSRNGGATVVHTAAGQWVITDEELKRFGLTHRDALNYQADLSRADSISRSMVDGMRAVTLMLKAQVSLYSACGTLGLNYQAIRSAAVKCPQLNDLLEEAKRNAK